MQHLRFRCPRSAPTFLFASLTALLAGLALASPAAALTVTQVSSASLQIDVTDALTGMYEGYAISTGVGESYSDLWVTSSQFAGPRIALASSEDGIKHVGPIAASSTKYVFFYLNASAAQAVAEDHHIKVFQGPITGTALLDQTISMTATARGGNMSNKVEVVTHTPSGPGIGATLVMTVTGTTGNVNVATPNIVLTPASRTDWPANVFELESLTAAFYSDAARTMLATQVDNQLALSIGDQPDRYYRIVYTFRITGIKTTTTIVQPVNYIYNGGSLKHTATTSMGYQDAIAMAGTIPQPTMFLTLKRSPASVAAESITGTASTSSIEAVGNTVQHTLRITNTFTENAVVDDYTDVFTASPATPRLVAGSISQKSWNGTTLTTTALADSVLGITGSTWKFTNFFIVPANGYLELLYTVSYTSDTGTYTQEATAHIGTAQIDTTTQAASATPDNAPAHATASVADTDGDGVRNSIDQDSDDDGISDLVESGMGIDPDADADNDGVQNFRDPNQVSCTDTTPANGICDSLPVSIDFDGDGVPNHRDLDSDGDGITDAYEAESGDGNGDGIPDGCAPVNGTTGLCNSGVIANPRDTDLTGGDDYLDTDSDGDGISDRNEAFDSSGDGVAELTPTGVDTDGDGIDNRFDPSCTGANCAGVTGAPVLAVLTSYQDQNQDGAPDWLQTCGDAYLTGSEACDDADLDDNDVCSNVCLRGNGVTCGGDSVCDSGICDGGLGTCQPCTDSTTGGTDAGCSSGTPACRTSSGTNSCRVCEASGGPIDDGCSGGSPRCDESAASGAGACGQCSTAADCNDGNACTTNTCSSASCSYPSLAAGSACGGGDVCDGAVSSPACVHCTDNPTPGADDFGCSGASNVCDEAANGGLGACVACVADADCDDGNACTTDSCSGNACSNASRAAGSACGSGDVCDGAVINPACVNCVDNPTPGADDFGCSGVNDVCDEAGSGGSGVCVDCLGDADCTDGNACTTDACLGNACSNASLPAGSACGVGDVCDGAVSSPACVNCVDNPTPGADDFGCSGTADVCDEAANAGAGACVECLGVADCDDGDACTNDSCGSNTCGHAAAPAGTACGGGDVCNGGVGGSACVNCVDNPTPGADDFGCSGVNDVCDEAANAGAGACVECLGDADCDDGNACTTDSCSANACGHASLAAGSACGSGDVCDGAASNPACVNCVDDPTPGADDFGCSGVNDVCDEAASGGAGACVECVGNADCDDGNACTADSCSGNSCSHGSLAAGSACGSGDVCDGAASNPACVNCVDDPTPGADDFGCSGSTAMCDESANSGAGACVECLGDVDCDDGDECTADSCGGGSCNHDPEPSGTACSGGVCDGQATPTCVTCLVDGDCGGGAVCVAQACVACEDDAPGTGTDHGCASGAPLCDESGASPVCVECFDDGQCQGGEVCSPSQLCVPGCSDDGDCNGSPTTPICDVDAMACVECLGASDCDDGDDCTVDTCDADACHHAPEPAGTTCATGVCDGNATPACLVCLDDVAPGSTDTGCNPGAPACDATANTGLGACVACDGAADCDDGNACTTDACNVHSCERVSLAAGSACGVGDVCDGAVSDPVCVHCADDPTPGADDFGCSGGTGLCDVAAAGGLGACVECLGASDCDDGNDCTTDACSAHSCTHGSLAAGSACGSGDVCDGALGTPACVHCTDNPTLGADDFGCSGSAALCDEAAAGGLGACVACLGAGDCDDADDCTADACGSGACSHDPEPPGTLCSGGVCDGQATPACLDCIDDAAPGAQDSGCSGSAPACDPNASGGPICLPCIADADCGGGDVCVASACTSCEDDVPGSGTDHGCTAGAPICDDGGASPTCVQCLNDGQCGSGEVCNPSQLCVPGCADDADCSGTSATPFCDTGAQACVECLQDDQCDGMLVCSAARACERPDSDGDGLTDDVDVDDDDDGVDDADELGGTDLSQDGDDDGVPDYADPDAQSCADSAPADGQCDALPVALDHDGDGVPNHLDLDSDADGLTDAHETGAQDDDGDGVPDDCLPVTGTGACSGGSVALPPNTDDPADALPDFLDTDSDGDGISDRDEAFDSDSDGDADTSPAATDRDGDGLDDAFDPDCAGAGDCAGVIGTSVGGALSGAQDANGDGTADWLEVCGDAYLTGSEPCDDGDLDDTDACSNACLLAIGESCADDAECSSTLCDGTLGTCEGCLDDATTGQDSGCNAGTPLCDPSAGAGMSACFECLVTADCGAGELCDATGTCVPGCDADADCAGSSATPLCDTDTHACVECLDAGDCDDDDPCTRDRCTAGSCSSPSKPAGTACAGGVCDGRASPACVECLDDGDCGAGESCDDHECVGPDIDGDSIPDAVDLDDDDDGIPDEVEGDDDLDSDGTPNYLDDDSDGDGLSDFDEGHDADFDGAADHEPTGEDSDGDGLDDAFDADCMRASDCDGVIGVPAPIPDLDDDGDANYLDADDDGDGRSTRDESEDAASYTGPAEDASDIDQDGEPNWYDTDSDGDGASDADERLDGGDLDDNGIPDALDPLFRAPDDDGDGLRDVTECPPPAYPKNGDCPDSDGDGKPDYLDADDDDDGIPTAVELAAEQGRDADDDGIPNYFDLDSDGDHIPDIWENGGSLLDADADGHVDDTTDEDGDGLAAVFDLDDGDPDATETRAQVDTDDDGIPDYLDLDSDDDGFRDRDEAGDHGEADEDDDGKLDFQDAAEEEKPEPEPMPPAETYSLQGGAFFGCSTSIPGSAGSDLVWSALGLVALAYSRRRRP